jgi:gamma-glutamylcyclotransferase (GGCT)/AIG2-like uncharacterized protein YtfP
VTLYFAYGSNMHVARLRARVPSGRPLAPASLAGYRLTFRKRGRDGSGKCTVLRTGDAQDSVHGMIFEIAPGDIPALDAAEGFGYDQAWTEVHSMDERRRVMIYLAREGFLDTSLRPFEWYKSLVLRGALDSELPPAYVDSIRAVAAIVDPDCDRDREHRSILDRPA